MTEDEIAQAFKVLRMTLEALLADVNRLEKRLLGEEPVPRERGE